MSLLRIPTCVARIAKPKEIDDINLVTAIQEFRNQDGTNVSSAASDKKFHKFLLKI